MTKNNTMSWPRWANVLLNPNVKGIENACNGSIPQPKGNPDAYPQNAMNVVNMFLNNDAVNAAP